jgi:hypothetical protein
MEKVLITGTGRSGKTFLVKLFTFLGYDTGYSRENYAESIKSNCNSGMERQITDSAYVLKNPKFMYKIDEIVGDRRVSIKQVIIPVRDYVESARSRVMNGRADGGLWYAENEKEQIEFYGRIMSRYVYCMVRYDIATVFLDFERMVVDSRYLYDRLSVLMAERAVSYAEIEKVATVSIIIYNNY